MDERRHFDAMGGVLMLFIIDFPTSPTLGQTYTYNGRTWVWDGTGWERQ